MFESVRSCSSGLLRAGSVAAPGRNRSGAPDAELYASTLGLVPPGMGSVGVKIPFCGST